MKHIDEYLIGGDRTGKRNNEFESLLDLKIGDKFYGVNSYNYCLYTIKKITQGNDYLYLYYDDKTSWVIYTNKLSDNDCTYQKLGSCCVTTIPEVAKEAHKKLCPRKKLEEK